MSPSQQVKSRRQVPADPEAAYGQWVAALLEGLPHTNWDEAPPYPSREWLWAAELADTPGGAPLADYVAGLTEEDLEESLVVELIAGCERIKSWAAARQAQLLTELHSRAAGAPRMRHLDDEVRVRMGMTSYSAGVMESRARELARYPEVAKALQVGWIDVRKADVLIDGVQTLPEAQGRAVQRMFIPTADRLTPPQLRRKVTAAVTRIDPELAGERHREAAKSRTVSLTPSADGMAWISAYLPAAQAMAAFTAIDVLAGDKDADDERTIGARRADAFSQVFTDILDRGVTPGGCALGTRQGARPHVILTMAASTWAGTDDLPADLVGYGPITAEAARQFANGTGAADVKVTTILTDPVDGSHLASHAGAPGTGAPGTADRTGDAAAAAARARAAAHRKLHPLLYPEDARSKDNLRLSGHDTAYLVELVDAANAAADPVGYLRTLGVLAADAYAPSAELRTHLVLRDRTCRFPGCSVPGWRCQIDHIQPFTESLPAWAQTAETNLHLLCGAHHQLKTSGRWRAWRDRYGATHWVTSHGYHYVVLAQGIDPGTDTELYRIAMAGLRAELGEAIHDLLPQATMDPVGADEYDPANLATENDLETIAEKLRRATGCDLDGQPATSAETVRATIRSARTRPRPRPWLSQVPRRSVPERAPKTRAGPAGAESSPDDESDRPPF